jgi:hypothetical protein
MVRISNTPLDNTLPLFTLSVYHHTVLDVQIIIWVDKVQLLILATVARIFVSIKDALINWFWAWPFHTSTVDHYSPASSFATSISPLV